jgi:RHS repeat-associated protein
MDNKDMNISMIASYSFPILDGVGNRKQAVVNEPSSPTLAGGDTEYTYNEKRNRLLSDQQSAFSYDLEGQLATRDSDTFTFDYEHRLKSVQQSAFSGQYLYDAQENRLKAVRDGVTTHYIYDMNSNVLAEADAGGAITRYYIHGLGLLAMVMTNDDVYTYHFNAIGSTVAVTNEVQEIVNTYAYDPFGNALNKSETILQPFKYVGQYGVMHEPNGFYYMRARYYDPSVQRFISEDPIGFEGGTINLYEYANNNPLLFIDPSGESVKLCYRALRGKKYRVGPFHHSYLEVNGTIYGFHPENDNAYDSGSVQTEEPGQDIKCGDPLKCVDDSCVLKKINETKNNPPNYSFGFYDCRAWAKMIILLCKKEDCCE